MARDPSFPPPLSELAQSGIGVAAAPSGGMGLALTPEGKLPAGVLFLGAQARRIASGVVTVTWPGASAVSDAVAVEHGLGVVPLAALATPNDQAGTGITFAVVFIGATVVTIQLSTTGFTPANTATNPVSWLAIG